MKRREEGDIGGIDSGRWGWQQQRYRMTNMAVLDYNNDVDESWQVCQR